MFYWDLSRNKDAIVSLLLLLFVHQSKSKTIRSKKATVDVRTNHLERSTPFVSSSWEYDDLGLVGERSPEFDVTIGDYSRGCESYDPVHGCTKCRSRYFVHVEFNPGRNRETGSCLHRCPTGFYGSRAQAGNSCKRCERSNCNVCFHVAYCMACAEGYLLHEASCVKKCPIGMGPDTGKKNCVEKVDCEESTWSSWSPCALRSHKKSCKYGRKRRNRVVVREPTENGKQCQKLKESKRCRTPDNKCPLVNKLFEKQRRQRNRKNRKRLRGRKNRRHEINNNDTRASRTRIKHAKAT